VRTQPDAGPLLRGDQNEVDVRRVECGVERYWLGQVGQCESGKRIVKGSICPGESFWWIMRSQEVDGTERPSEGQTRERHSGRPRGHHWGHHLSPKSHPPVPFIRPEPCCFVLAILNVTRQARRLPIGRLGQHRTRPSHAYTHSASPLSAADGRNRLSGFISRF